MCEPRLLILYKGDDQGHQVDLRANFKFQNNSKYPQITEQLTEETEKNTGIDKLTKKERLKNIKTQKYVYINPYDYIRNSPELQKKYDISKKLPQRKRQKDFREILEKAKSMAYDNLEYFMRHKYDVVFVNPGDINEFLIKNPTVVKIYKTILFYPYSTKHKKGYDVGNTHNISKVLPHMQNVLILKDEKPVLEFSEELKNIDMGAIKTMDEGDRILRYYKPVEGGNFKFETVKFVNVIIWMFIIAFIFIIALLFVDELRNKYCYSINILNR